MRRREIRQFDLQDSLVLILVALFIGRGEWILLAFRSGVLGSGRRIRADNLWFLVFLKQLDPLELGIKVNVFGT